MIRQLLKLVLVCLLIPLLSSTCFGQLQYFNTTKSFNVTGKVDSIVQRQFIVNRDSAHARRLSLKVGSVFNEKGFLTEDRYYLTEDPPGVIVTDNRRLLNVNTYSDKDHLSEIVHYDVKGIPYAKEVYTFDLANNTVESKNYELPSNELAVFTKMLFDKKGKMVDVSVYNSVSVMFNKLKFKYNDKGYRIEEITITPETLKEHKILRTFDSDGNVIKEVNYTDLGEISSTNTYNYPKYDEMHNWITQEVYFNGKLSRIEERTIVYRK